MPEAIRSSQKQAQAFTLSLRIKTPASSAPASSTSSSVGSAFISDTCTSASKKSSNERLRTVASACQSALGNRHATTLANMHAISNHAIIRNHLSSFALDFLALSSMTRMRDHTKAREASRAVNS